MPDENFFRIRRVYRYKLFHIKSRSSQIPKTLNALFCLVLQIYLMSIIISKYLQIFKIFLYFWHICKYAITEPNLPILYLDYVYEESIKF